VNGDGWPDIAVARFLGGNVDNPTSYTGGGVKLYYGMSTYPYVRANYTFATNPPLANTGGFPCYSVALGDFGTHSSNQLLASLSLSLTYYCCVARR